MVSTYSSFLLVPMPPGMHRVMCSILALLQGFELDIPGEHELTCLRNIFTVSWYVHVKIYSVMFIRRPLHCMHMYTIHKVFEDASKSSWKNGIEKMFILCVTI